MLIRRAELLDGRVVDVRVRGKTIDAVGELAPVADERVIDARGGLLLPGLNDHHVHLFSLAASLDSVRCGPPEVNDADTLAARLSAAQPRASDGWIRGFGYTDHVAGPINRAWLDRCVPHHPVRIQHRSGRLWMFNTAGVKRLSTQLDGLADGRVFDQDRELREFLPTATPNLEAASQLLASFGVTGITDMTPTNDPSNADAFSEAQHRGSVTQNVSLAGTAALNDMPPTPALRLGPTKVHLHEATLPAPSALVATIAHSHDVNRAVAVHCVTEAELAFALSAFEQAGVTAGDRIEHASSTPPVLLDAIAELALTVVTQPNFVAERGDAYLHDIADAEQPWLYRCKTFLDRGIPLAGGTDFPFGHPDPWRAIHAAVERKTAKGVPFTPQEALTPEQAIALYLGGLEAPTRVRHPAVGATADLCLLDAPWRVVRERLDNTDVRGTWCRGELVYDCVDQPPL